MPATAIRPDGTGRHYYGWRIVVLCAVALGLSAPGQTAGVSVFIDPMMADLDISRTTLSTAYLVGTLAGAGSMPGFGTFLDRRGVRLAMTLVAGSFALVLAAMAGVRGVVTLTLGFVGIRMLGQGALSLYATTAVSHWFDRRRGRAVGLTAAGGQALMTVAPLSLAAVILAVGWRQAWLVAAAVVAVVGIGIAWFGMRDGPAAIGQFVDGRPPTVDDPTPVAWGVTRTEAMRSLMFWAISGGVIATGLIGTALAFHQVSVLGEQGLTPIEAAANFVPQTIAGLVATLGTGVLVDRVRPRIVLAASMASLAGAILVLPLVSPGFTAALYGAALGAAGGSARSLEAAALPRLFGTLHLGSIRGVVMSVTVVGTAIAPVMLSLGFAASGSYQPVLNALLVLPATVVITGLIADRPDGARTSAAGTAN